MVKVQKSAHKSLVRRLNMSLILGYLRTSDRRTRASLAASTGLTRATVSTLVDELIALNLVRETGLQHSQGGRPATRLELNPEGGCVIGIEIGVGFIAAALTDFIANIRWRDRVELDTSDPAKTVSIAEKLALEAEHRGRALSLKVLGIGLVLPGLIKTDEGRLKFAPNLGWHDMPFQEMWEKRFGVPVHVVNDGNAAALGEHYFGVAAGYHDFIFINAAVGIGAGIMIDGKLFQGVEGYAGEVGHMVIDPGGALCPCGRRGCWEKAAGIQALLKYVIDAVRSGRFSRAWELAEGKANKLTPDMIAQAAAEGDPLASEAITRITNLFGIGVMNLINTFNPQLIVIGGSLSRVIEPFLPIVESVVSEQSFRTLTDKVVIKISSLGDDACLMGAVAAVLDTVFADPAQRSEKAQQQLPAISLKA